MAICLVDGRVETTRDKAAASADSTGGIDADGTRDARKEGSESVDKGNPSSTLANHIRFFKNGQSMGNSGIGFNNINLGTYYPAISCYGEGRAYLNFGPNFVYPPKGLPSEMVLRPISELCVPPPLPEEAVERVIPSGGSKEGKNAFFSKRTDDNILLAFKELVRVEAIVRHQAYLKHTDLHMLEISAIRKEHGLPALDDQQHSHTT
jgi:Set1/Ash2 histone methyltransferase complex subunit ASH2